MTEDFYRGVAVALTVLAAADAETYFREIVSAVDGRELLRVAKKDGVLRASGFTRYGYRFLLPRRTRDEPSGRRGLDCHRP